MAERLGLICALCTTTLFPTAALSAPSVPAPPPQLPVGKLLFISSMAGSSMYGFAILDGPSPKSGVVSMYFYEIIDPPIPGAPNVSQAMVRFNFDCIRGIRQSLGTWYYDKRDAVVFTDGPSAPVPIARGPLEDNWSRYACTGKYEPAGQPPVTRQQAVDTIHRMVAARANH